MAKSASSQRWLKEHEKDRYVKQAKAAGYRSRAVFKLQEIQKKYTLIRPGMTVVDLGAAPGGWSQMASTWVGPKGQVIALDILPMEGLSHVRIIEGDFCEEAVLNELEVSLGTGRADVVLSDMAPNLTGLPAVDQPRAYYLAELALSFAENYLSGKGVFFVKLFQGVGFEDYLAVLRKTFKKVVLCKPDASRARSRELYALARGLKFVTRR